MRTFRQLLEELSKSSVNNIGRSREQLLKRVNAEGLGEHPSGDNINHFSDLIRDAPDHHQNWIIPRYAKGKIGHTEDIGQILDNLKTHDDLKERELIHPSTLSKLGDGSDLHGLIRKLTDPNTLNVARTAEFSFDPKQFTVTGENKDWTIVTPHTLDAAIHFGRDTSWCTANKCSSHNHYESYTDAPLHTLIPKNPRHKGERYQLYLDPRGSKTQLKDHENRSVDINSIFNGIIGHGRGNAVTKPLPGIFHYLHQIKTDPKVLTDAIIRGDIQHVAAADPSSLDFSKTDPDILISSNSPFAHKTVINHHPEHIPAVMQLMGKDLDSGAQESIARQHSEHVPALMQHMGKDLHKIAQYGLAHRPEHVLALMQHMGKDLHSDAQYGISQYPEHVLALMQHMGKDLDSGAQASIGANHSEHVPALMQLMGKDLHSGAQRRIAEHREHVPALMRLMGKDLDREAQYDIANHPEHVPALMQLMGKDLDREAQYGISQYPKHVPALMRLMGKDLHSDAQYGIAQHSKHVSALMQLMDKDLHPRAQHSIAEHHEHVPALMQLMGKDLGREAQYDIAEHREHVPALMQLMDKDLHSGAQDRIANHPEHIPALMQHMGKYLHPKAQYVIAEHPEHVPALMKLMGKDLHPKAQHGIAYHSEHVPALMRLMGKDLDRGAQYGISQHSEHVPALMQLMGEGYIKMRTFRQLLEELSKSSVNNIGRSREQLLKRVNAEGLGEHPSGDNINHFSDLIRDAPDHHQNWIIPRYAKGKIGHTEDIGQILDNLKTHDDLKERELIHPRTLSKLGYGSDLHGLIRKLTDPNTLNVARTAEFSFDPKQFTVTGENKDWTIVTPHTLDAAIHFGRDTSWCTANKCSSHNHYESYTDAPLHTLIPKNPRHKGERYQLYLDPTGSKTQLKDHENRSVDINSIFNGIIGHGRGNAVTKPLPGIFHYLHQIKTDPKVLTDAIIRGDIQHMAASNPSFLDFSKTDPDRLISSNSPFAHKTVIDHHPEHIPAVMQLMGKDLDPGAQYGIAQHSKHVSALMQHMGKYLHPKAQYVIAEHPEHVPALMQHMGKALHSDAQHSIAQQYSEHVLALMQLMGKDLHSGAQRRIGANHSEHVPALMQLMGKDLHPDAQYGIANHPEHVPALMRLMGKDLDREAQYGIANHPEHVPALMQLMGKNLHPDAQYVIAEHREHVPALMQHMGKALHSDAQYGIAQHSKHVPALMQLISKDLHPKAQDRIGQHSGHVPALMQHMGKDLDPDAQDRIAFQHSEHVPALMQLMDKDLHPDAQDRIARQHSEHVPALMQHMGKDLHKIAQYGIANHPEHVPALMQHMGKDLHPKAQYHIAHRPEHVLALMQHMGKDLHPDAQYHIANHPEHVPALMQLMGKDLHSDARHYIDRNHPMIQKESAIRRYRNILREVTIHGIDSDNVTDADVGTFTPYPSSPTSQFKVDYDSIIPGDSSPIKIKSIFRHFNGVVCPEFTVQGDHTRNPNMSQSLPVNISIYQTLLKHFMHHINTTRSIGMEAVRVSYGTTDSGKDKLYGHISSALGLPSVNGLTPIQRTRETRANQEKFHADQEKIRPY